MKQEKKVETLRQEKQIEPMLKTWRGIRLVIGGAASGKSEYAERMALEGPGARVYLATMRRSISAEARIKKHVDRRREMGFITMEDPYLDLSRWNGLATGVILLEDLPNLLANRMFRPDSDGSSEDFGKKESAGMKMNVSLLIQTLKADIQSLAGHTEQLIIVSGNLFEDGREYDEMTERYLAGLGEIHRWLAEHADKVTEVVCGIPIDH